MSIENSKQVSGSKPCPPPSSFLLRCWQEAGDGEPIWRFTLVQVGGETAVKGFARLGDIFEYLDQRLNAAG